MRALLDVNVLIALLDTAHVHHAIARQWIEIHIGSGWASCPLTQNGCVRILSTESYPRRQPLHAVIERLREATSTPHHQFWPDEVSVLDPHRFDHERWLTAAQVTDAYLLALAVHRGGCLVTLDRRVDLRLVHGARPEHLSVI